MDGGRRLNLTGGYDNSLGINERGDFRGGFLNDATGGGRRPPDRARMWIDMEPGDVAAIGNVSGHYQTSRPRGGPVSTASCMFFELIDLTSAAGLKRRRRTGRTTTCGIGVVQREKEKAPRRALTQEPCTF
jgi:hypothetical protein